MSQKETKQNKSMFIYTSLIFLVALILIMLAFFGKINRPAQEAPQPTETATVDITESIDKLKEDITALNDKINMYEHLIKANSYVSFDMIEEAKAEIVNISADSLTEEQKVLYEQIMAQINK